MTIVRLFAVAAAVALAGCASNAINPTLTSTNPEIFRIGGDQPQNPAPVVENLGGFCVQTAESWKSSNEFNGQKLWVKDVARGVVQCK